MSFEGGTQSGEQKSEGRNLETKEAFRFRLQRLMMRQFAGVPLVAGVVARDLQELWVKQRAEQFDIWYARYSEEDIKAKWQQFSEATPEVQEQLVANWFKEMEQVEVPKQAA